MAFRARLLLKDTPFRYLFNFFSTVQSLSIILDNSETTGREVLRELGFEWTQINYLFDRYRRPVSEALLLSWRGTVQDLYRVLLRTNQREALLRFYTHLYENIYSQSFAPDALTEEDWRTILESTQYRISPAINRPQVFMRTYILPIWSRVSEIVCMLFPINTTYAQDMYRKISKVMNNMSIFICFLTFALNGWYIFTEGRPHNLVAILISLSLWIKLYLMKEPFHRLQQIMPVGNDRQEIREADFLYKEVRIALLFVFYFKLALALLGLALFYIFPQFLLKDLQSQMTYWLMFFFTLELVHNAFYLIKFYRYASIFRGINDLFPM